APSLPLSASTRVRFPGRQDTNQARLKICSSGGWLAEMANGERELIISTVRKFVEKEVIPIASELEHRNEYPYDLVRQMKEMGLFGLNIPEQYGGADVDATTFAMVFEEISRGWMGLAGVLGSNSVMCDVLVRFGTEEQKRRLLPDMATGEKRGGICLTE